MSTFAVTGVVLFAIPLALGLFAYISPLQVGARGVAFPRLNLLSFWLFVSGGFTIFGSYLWRPSEAGFAAFPPLSEPLYSNTHGVDAWIVGTALALLGFVCFGVNLVVTLRNMRAPGHGLAPRPALHVGGQPLRLPGDRLRLGDARRAHHAVHRPELRRRLLRSGYAGAPILYEHLAWFFFTGAFAFIVVFAAGVISDVLPAFARKPLFSHRGAMACMLAIAILGAARVDAQHVHGADPDGVPGHRDAVRDRADDPDRPPDLQLDRHRLGRHAPDARGGALRNRGDQRDDRRPRG